MLWIISRPASRGAFSLFPPTQILNGVTAWQVTAAFLFLRIQFVHLRPCHCLSFIWIRLDQAISKAFLLNAEGKTSALVIAESLAQLRVLFRERKQSVFEAGVVCPDHSPLVSLVEVYFGRFMRFLNACDHIFQKPSVFPFRDKHPYFCSKKPRSSSALFAKFQTEELLSGYASFVALKIGKNSYFLGVHRNCSIL